MISSAEGNASSAPALRMGSRPNPTGYADIDGCGLASDALVVPAGRPIPMKGGSCYLAAMAKLHHPHRSKRAQSFVLGRDRFARISAVEGIALTDDMRATLERFDREGLSAAERRRAILARFVTAR